VQQFGATNRLERKQTEWDSSTVTLTTDKKSRLCSAELFKPRTSYQAEKTADGSVLLRELAPVSAKNQAHIEKRGKRWVIVTERPVTAADVQAALVDFP
jgi:hypothetical protein